jgi:sugar O-acyltransferase (sialic acid O-acetyltransferase NeuD family)
MNGLVIIGSGGQSLVAYDAVRSLGTYEDIIIMDNPSSLPTPIKADFGLEYIESFKDTHDFFVALISNESREKMCLDLISKGYKLINIIHHTAFVSNTVILGVNIFVGPLANLHTAVKIGDGSIINSKASIDHNSIVHDYCHIAPGCVIAGNVVIGNRVFIGTGSVVINGISIENNCIIGANSLVLKSIHDEGTYVGSPVRKIR